MEEIEIMQDVLSPYQGRIYFEYAIPRMGFLLETYRVRCDLVHAAAAFWRSQPF